MVDYFIEPLNISGQEAECSKSSLIFDVINCYP